MSIHAITGCDTASAIHRQGKCKAFNHVHNKRDYYLLDTFTNKSSTHDEVQAAGELFIKKLYGAKKYNTLDNYRHIAYRQSVRKASLASSFELANLPPTSAAAKQHSFRAYHTVQGWLGQDLPPEEWGWKRQDSLPTPVETDQPFAADSLLNMVSCGYKEDGCSSMLCSCKKNLVSFAVQCAANAINLLARM